MTLTEQQRLTVLKALEGMHYAYVSDVNAANDIMRDLGRICDPAQVMVTQFEKITGYREAISIMKRGGVE